MSMQARWSLVLVFWVSQVEAGELVRPGAWASGKVATVTVREGERESAEQRL